MSPRPRRKFWKMGFHFLTPIYHFLSKPDPKHILVSYSRKTLTLPQTPTMSQKPKNFYDMKKKCIVSQLFLQIWVSCTKYSLNFQELSFTHRYTGLETWSNPTSKTKIPLPGHLTSMTTLLKQFSVPGPTFINLPVSQGILAQLSLDVGQHQLQSLLGYPTRAQKERIFVLGYPSATFIHC